ncbi:MAG: four helix bundle protein [Candidatus Binatia bacterium]
MRSFDHERLIVYRSALDFLALAEQVVGAMPRGRAYLADQLYRAAASICLDIAEGAGEFSAADKARFYRMARRSATECAAILDVCARIQIAVPEPLAAGRELLLQIVAMLTTLARRPVGAPHAHS